MTGNIDCRSLVLKYDISTSDIAVHCHLLIDELIMKTVKFQPARKSKNIKQSPSLLRYYVYLPPHTLYLSSGLRRLRNPKRRERGERRPRRESGWRRRMRRREERRLREAGRR